jgi:hypothetical protein
MAEKQPQSRPQPPEPQTRPGEPKPGESVYGGQWGRGGKPDDGDTGRPDRPEPISPTDNKT